MKKVWVGADVSSPGPWVRAASGWGRRPLFLQFGTTACDLALASMLFPTTVLEFPLSPLPAPQRTFTKPHCRPSYRDITPGPGALPTFQEKPACGSVPGQPLQQMLLPGLGLAAFFSVHFTYLNSRFVCF